MKIDSNRYSYCAYCANKEPQSKAYKDYDYVKMSCDILSRTIEKCQERINIIKKDLDYLKDINRR